MNGIIDWAAARARMILAFIVLSLAAGGFAYVALPKEGEPDIEIPALFVSVPFPGISAADSERLLVKVMEAELAGLDGLKKISATAAEGYAGVALEFEFGWDKAQTIADVRDKMSNAEAQFPAGFDRYSLNEINFSQFPIIIVALSGEVPERELLRLAKDLQDRLEALEPVLDAGLAGQREEMLEVVIDPLRLEAYDVSASDLISVVVNNNRLVAAGDIETETGAFAVKIPASFRRPADVYGLTVKAEGDRVVTLGDIADIRLTFEDRRGTARYNGETTLALQVVKRKGFNLIDTAELVRRTVAEAEASWPAELRDAITVATAVDQSVQVDAMVSQLEGSVLTAIALVMVVVLASLGTRSALLVGFSIPTSFLLTFALFAVLGYTVSNIVMFGLILAVGMLVDGAIVVVEYADKRISEGQGPMRAYVEAAKRMFWPVVSSTATTLCAFLPLLLWPGVAGEFMGMLPLTLIFVLTASLIVALIYVPVMGGVFGRLSRVLGRASGVLRRLVPVWPLRALLVAGSAAVVFAGAVQSLNPGYLPGGVPPLPAPYAALPGSALFLIGCVLTSITVGAVLVHRGPRRVAAGYRRSPFGRVIAAIAGNPVMPLVTVAGVVAFVAATFAYYGENNRGVEFFVATEPEQSVLFVRARGNFSLEEKDALLAAAEAIVLETEGVASTFAFAGNGGLNANLAGASAPLDTIGQVQFELAPWEARRHDPALDGNLILDRMQAQLERLPGVQVEILSQSRGPAGAKPVHLRLKGDDLDALREAAAIVAARFAATPGLVDIDDSRPLPGIDWQIDVDVQAAGRFGADVAAVGGMVQLVTRGILLDRMRPAGSEDEIEIRVRLPEDDRVLSTLDSLKVRTRDGMVPLSNFTTRTPVAKLARIDRVDQSRFLDVRAAVTDGLVNDDGRPINGAERIEHLTDWLTTTNPLPEGVSWEWTGDQQDQDESSAFLGKAFAGALGLMFVILLAQFNSFYNATLVLLAVVLSTAGVLVGMLVMDQTFSIIMTGTGILALAGIVVNNNIVLIDTYQEYARYMPPIEAIIRTAEDRIRPVFLTTVTTIAGLMPMMFGVSLDFFAGGYTIDSPTALWWKQLATAVVFGLGIATVLTLVLTPALLAVRVWIAAGAYGAVRLFARMVLGRSSRVARDAALSKAARRHRGAELLWEDALTTAPASAAADAGHGRAPAAVVPLRAAE